MSIKIKTLTLLFLSWAFMLAPINVQASDPILIPSQTAEHIENYDVRIDVQKSGDLLITETIDVLAQSRQIRRGIFRDFPRYLDANGTKVEQEYNIVSVTKGGVAEPYKLNKDGNAIKLRIGNPDLMLERGPYRYEIKYEIANQIRFFDTHEELYWNAIGHYWNFDIQAASATVIMPRGALASDYEAYTGRLGSKAVNYTHEKRNGAHVFISTQPLLRHEGMTLSISFPKGTIDPPSAAALRALWWAKNGAILIFSGLAALLSGFYGWAWNKVGRDPLKPPVFPRYEPPQNYGPAACARIFKRNSGGANRALISTLISLAHKDRIVITSTKKHTEIKPISPMGSRTAPLNPEETYLIDILFAQSKEPITLTGRPNRLFHRVSQSFSALLSKTYGSKYFNANMGYGFLGLLVGMAGCIITKSLFPALATHLLIISLIIVWLAAIAMMYLLRAPTKLGQEAMAEIEGFALYLKMAEVDRINTADVNGVKPPAMTEALYERFMPYAVALDLEKPWTKMFESVLPEVAANYAHNNMRGDFGGRSLEKSTRQMISAMSSGVSRAAPQSSGSSGRGGGGSSGGGGGGGGGGGW